MHAVDPIQQKMRKLLRVPALYSVEDEKISPTWRSAMFALRRAHSMHADKVPSPPSTLIYNDTSPGRSKPSPVELHSANTVRSIFLVHCGVVLSKISRMQKGGWLDRSVFSCPSPLTILLCLHIRLRGGPSPLCIFRTLYQSAACSDCRSSRRIEITGLSFLLGMFGPLSASSQQ